VRSIPLRETPAYPAPDAAAEANHRIANNLVALSTVFTKRLPALEQGPDMVPRALVVDLIREMAGRLRAMGRLHHLLIAVGDNERDVDLGEVLSEVIAAFRDTGMFGDSLKIRLNAEGHRVDAARASMLMMIVAEIATNSVKHAHPTGIPVEFAIQAMSTPAGNLLLHIADDGVGLPEGFNEQRDSGPGLKLVRGLVEYAGGSLSMRSGPLGLKYSIELPSP
jgi:two-component sensor histidine kinase